MKPRRAAPAAPRRSHEVELGPPVVAWLEGEGFEVFQEVAASSGVADLVGVCGPLVGVVELKTALSFELLYQARRWRGVAHQVWIAIPDGKETDARREALRAFRENGVGVLLVRDYSGVKFVELRERPEFNRRAEVQRVRRYLRAEQKTFAPAGSLGGAHWTEFKGTCDRVRVYLATHPGATIGDVVRDVRHHYASDAGARARLVKLIERGVVEGVRVEREGPKRTPTLYLDKEGKPT